MMKRTYNKPILTSEAFVSNTYVAACALEGGEKKYYLACNGGNDDREHTVGGCLDPDAYEISIDDQGYIKSIWEVPNDENPDYSFKGEYAQNITVNGGSYKTNPIHEGDNYLTWTTIYGIMKHTGILNLKTAPLVKNIS